MRSVNITVPYADDPTGYELSQLTRALFNSPRHTGEQGICVALNDSLKELRLSQFAVRATGAMPILNSDGQAIAPGQLVIDCLHREAHPRLLGAVMPLSSSRLRMALLYQGIGRLFIIDGGQERELPLEWDPAERVILRHHYTDAEGFRQLLDGANACSDELLIAVTQPEDRREMADQLGRPRERAALYQRGFRRILFGEHVLILTGEEPPQERLAAPEDMVNRRREVAIQVLHAMAQEGLYGDALLADEIAGGIVRTQQRRQHVTLDLTQSVRRYRHNHPLKTYQIMRLFRHLRATFATSQVDWYRDEGSYYRYHFLSAKPQAITPLRQLLIGQPLYQMIEETIAHSDLRTSILKPLSHTLYEWYSRFSRDPSKRYRINLEAVLLLSSGMRPTVGDTLGMLERINREAGGECEAKIIAAPNAAYVFTLTQPNAIAATRLAADATATLS